MKSQSALNVLFLALVLSLFGVGCGSSESTPSATSVAVVPVSTSTASVPTVLPTTALPTPTPVPPTATPILVPPTATSTPLPPTPTVTPIPPTFTPSPMPVSGPKPGRWAGDKVSFTVTKEGVITDFEIEVMHCQVSMEDEIPVEPGGSYGSFTINPHGVFRGENVETGTDLSVVATFETETTLTGTYTVQICGASLFFNQSDVVWAAEWLQP